MKNRKLAFQIWIVIATVTIAVCVLIMVLIPIFLKQYFEGQMYQTIESTQSALTGISKGSWEQEAFTDIEKAQEKQNRRAVQHVLLNPRGNAPAAGNLPVQLVKPFREKAIAQTEPVGRYSLRIQGETLFFVIRKGEVLRRNAFLISYMWDDYYQELVGTMVRRMAVLTVAVLLLSWLPAIGLARYLSRPLVELEASVSKIADRRLQTPIRVDRGDEIGRLAASVEKMREQLLIQDEAQKLLLQHISHELKTPVMVIRSYAQSLQDGIYPKGDLQSSVAIIQKESARLDKRIRDLLYLTKLDYMAEQEPQHTTIELDLLAEDVIERLRFHRSELEWTYELAPLHTHGDAEQWKIALENLLDNQMRYAANRVEIGLLEHEEAGRPYALLRIWNDGPPLEDDMAGQLFQPFRKGSGGQFGLGLAIVRRVAQLHEAQVHAANENRGVAFYLRIPLAG